MMTRINRLTIVLLTALMLSLAGCGGGGGGGLIDDGGGNGGVDNGGGNGVGDPVVTDNDGDGIPNDADALPDDESGFITLLVTQLERLNGGSFSAALSISGTDLVGFSDNDSSITKGARWSVGDATPVELRPISDAAEHYSAAYGVNGLGFAVGESENATGDSTVAAYWRPANNLAVPLLPLGTVPDAVGVAYSINDSGQIVGDEVIDDAGNTTALVWSDSSAMPLDLGTLGGDFSSAYHISDGGRIVGESQLAGGAVHGVLWTPLVAGVGYSATELPPLPGHVASMALGIDAGGRVVGESEAADGTRHGVLWSIDGGTVSAIDLGASSSAQAINDFNRIAGYVAAGTENAQAVVVDTRNLNLPQAVTGPFSQAYDISDSDLVVGLAGTRAMLAEPQ